MKPWPAFLIDAFQLYRLITRRNRLFLYGVFEKVAAPESLFMQLTVLLLYLKDYGQTDS